MAENIWKNSNFRKGLTGTIFLKLHQQSLITRGDSYREYCFFQRFLVFNESILSHLFHEKNYPDQLVRNKMSWTHETDLFGWWWCVFTRIIFGSPVDVQNIRRTRRTYYTCTILPAGFIKNEKSPWRLKITFLRPSNMILLQPPCARYGRRVFNGMLSE